MKTVRLLGIASLAVWLTCVGGVAPGADLSELEEKAMRDAVARVAPSVVRIQTVGGLAKAGGFTLGTGPTTGVVVSEDGYIISSAFGFASEPTTILVHLPDKPSRAARLIATDHSRQLVLLKIDLEDGEGELSLPDAAAREDVKVGAWAIAVGRTFEGDQPNMSIGIVSAIDRIWSKAIQTDAKISPSNYGGPVVDIRGRVFGVLVPLTPQAARQSGGVGLYDSGIGFAVPLVDIQRILPRLKEGKDLHAGVMGISFASRDQFAVKPTIKVVQGNSPAYEAGLRGGDTIVKVNGQPVENQAQVKHQVSPFYAGDTVKVTVKRKDKQLDFEVQLTDKLEPYEHPFLGILPRRDADKSVLVRYVYPDSGAGKAGVKVGDRITKLADKDVARPADMYDALDAFAPGDSVKIGIERGSEKLEVQIALGKLPTKVPAELPAAREKEDGEAAEKEAQVGEFEIKLPEFKNECVAYVPEKYDPAVAHGVVVWLHVPGRFDREALMKRWKPHCDAHDLILVAPQARDREQWHGDESEFIGRVLGNIRDEYNVDDARTVVHGYQGGGKMAFVFAASDHGSVHGLAVVDATMARSVRPPALEPTVRAAVYWAFATESREAKRVAAQIKALGKLRYPITEKELPGEPRYLDDAEFSELVRWIDSLDRI